MKNLTLNENNECIPTWHIKACNEVFEKLNQSKFPCFFGASAAKKNKIRFFYIRGKITEDSLEEGLDAFNDFCNTESIKDCNLAITLGDCCYKYRDKLKEDLWGALQKLDSISSDENFSSPIEFRFKGEPFFVLVTGPFYINTPSRVLSDYPVLFFQPREVFRGYEAGTKPGTIVRKKIRDRVKEYDGKPLHSIVGPTHEKPASWWRYYFIPDK